MSLEMPTKPWALNVTLEATTDVQFRGDNIHDHTVYAMHTPMVW